MSTHKNRLALPIADKSLGQHFLKDQKVIANICADYTNLPKGIVEIGPGPGILTESLAELKIPFHVIEMDQRFGIYLDQFINREQVTMGDALQTNIEEFIKEKFHGDPIWLVSNLPYNVASPLLINFLQAPSIDSMTLMFQQEVADKVCAFVTKKNIMNSLMVLSQTYFDCKLLLRVPPGAFSPPPRVESAVISMKRLATPHIPLLEFRALEKFVRMIFAQKRKQLGGILKANYEVEKIHAVFNTLGIELTVRAEALTLNNVLDLYRNFKL